MKGTIVTIVKRRFAALLSAVVVGTAMALPGTMALGAPSTSPSTASVETTATPPASLVATPDGSTSATPSLEAQSSVQSDPTPQAAVTPAALGAGEEAITQKAVESAAVLGSATSGIICGLVDGGCYQTFQNGAIYWSPSAGAHYIKGAIRAKWLATGAQDGFLGYPLTDEVCGLRDGGCRQEFQGGMIYWSSRPGAYWVVNAIRDRYAISGSENGLLGYPLTDEVCGLRSSGCRQEFQGGMIYWSSRSGAHWVVNAILDRYAISGWENGLLAYPVSDERCGLRDGGCLQSFQGGMIYWSSRSGAHWVVNAILDKWASTGWEDGFLGYPTTDEKCGLLNGGCVSSFQGGDIYWYPGGDPHSVRGDFRTYWAGTGWENGKYGYPASDENCVTGTGGSICTQNFQHDYLRWRNGVGVIDCTRMKCIAMTFDDGPGQYTGQLLDTLERNNVQSTFFVEGQNVIRYPATEQRAYRNRNEVMNHSWNHPNLPTLGYSEILSQLTRTSDTIQATTGERPYLMRPPYGAYNTDVVKAAAAEGMSVILWNVETSDWETLSTSTTIQYATNRAVPGGIILMHDIHQSTVDAIPTIISNLKSKGYTLVTVGDMLFDPQPGQIHTRG